MSEPELNALVQAVAATNQMITQRRTSTPEPPPAEPEGE